MPLAQKVPHKSYQHTQSADFYYFLTKIINYQLSIVNLFVSLHRFGVIRSKANAHEVLNY